MTWVLKIAALLLLIYGLIVFAAWLGQRRLLYVPDATRVAPSALSLAGVSEIELKTPDGERLVAWRLKARPGQPTLLYFHGNAGNLASRANRVARYAALGYGMLMLSYRGYSGSSGRPSEAHNFADALLAYEHLVGEGLSPHDIVLYGESLGSGVAVHLATQRPVGAVVLDAPYTSIVAMAQRAYPYLPVRPLLADRYESDKIIKRIGAPLLVLHGTRDGIIPVSMGRALYDMAEQPKKLVIFPEGHHSDLDDYGAVRAVSEWLADIRRGPA
jgi:fermentation-respiration switch protein FrsA (DUF1100 family)